MKKLIYFLACTYFLAACNQVKTEKKDTLEKVSISKDTIKKHIIEKDTIELEKEEPSSAVFNNNLISLEKTPCSGECPIFQIEISKDSILTYKGIEGVSIIGERKLKLTNKQFSKIAKAIQDSDFENLEEAYENAKASDFSKTIISYNNKDITVRLWKDAPEKLTALYVVIEDILYDNKFLE